MKASWNSFKEKYADTVLSFLIFTRFLCQRFVQGRNFASKSGGTKLPLPSISPLNSPPLLQKVKVGYVGYAYGFIGRPILVCNGICRFSTE
jgi:hypothetical protein